MTHSNRKMDIHTWFSLSYANYLVLHRSMLQSMPMEWQHKFVGLVQELDKYFGYPDIPSSCTVIWRGKDGKFIKNSVPTYDRGRTVLTKKNFKSLFSRKVK